MRLRSRLPLVLWGIVVVMQAVSPAEVWSILFWALGALLLFSYLWARQMAAQVHLSRRLIHSWLVVGDVLAEEFTLTNRSFLPVLWAEVADESEVPGYTAGSVQAIEGYGKRSWTASAVCQRRGIFHLGPHSLHLSDPFGLFLVVRTYAERQTIVVYPRVAQLPHFLLPRGDVEGMARASKRTVAPTALASSVRPYMPTDPLRHIHWPLTAHRGRLMVKEFDWEPSGPLWVLVDLHAWVQQGEGAESTEEYGVTLAASLVAAAERANRAVGLIAFGQESLLLPPRSGRAQLWWIWRHLAAAQVSPQWPLADLLRHLKHHLGRGQTLSLITPDLSGHWLVPLLDVAQRGVSPGVILLDADTFVPSGDGRTAGRAYRLRSLLAEHGLPSYIVAQGFPFRPLFRHRRRRVAYRTLWGTGRVVPVEVVEDVG